MRATIDTKSIKAGGQIYLARFTGHDMNYMLATVTKVTPAGMVDASINGTAPMRFRADGQLMGGKGYHEYELDAMPFEEREASIENERHMRTAAVLVGAIAAQCNVNYRWGKDGLAAELDRLQSEIDTARKTLAEVKEEEGDMR